MSKPKAKSLIVEIRPGEGGDDAHEFARELAETVRRLATKNNHDCLALTADTRVVTLQVTGQRPRRLNLHRLAGTHRVQRVPSTGGGRRHTSTATIAVLTDATPDAVELDPADVIEDTHRGTGKGGQHQNTTDSAVRLTHVPSGITVSVQGRKQWQNRVAAWDELRSRIAHAQMAAAAAERNEKRTQQVSGTDRAAKGWTWCAYRDQVTDHQTGQTWRYRDVARGKVNLAS